MKKEFKVGDRVKVVNKDSSLFNRESTIIETNKGRLHPYVIEIMDMPYASKDLELIEEAKEKTIVTFSDNPINYIEIKDTRLERLDELIKAVNTLGSLGVEVELKITIELDGKKIEL